MFLKNIKALSQKTSFRLATGLAFLFMLSSLVFFVLVYFFFFQSLKSTDRSLITSKLNEYSSILHSQGPQGLHNLFARDQALRNDSRFSVRVQDKAGHTVFFRLSDDLHEFDIQNIEKPFQDVAHESGWSYFQATDDEDQLEILTSTAGNEWTIQVAKSTSERQDSIEEATQVFTISTVIAAVLGGLGGFWFSNRALKPVRELLQTTQAISKENLFQRAKDSGSKDEISELVQVFNSMLDRIQILVNGMQNSLDSIAHDIKTPMTRLKAAADLALSKTEPSLEDCRAALEECSMDSDEILSLLNCLLDIYEADAGAMKLKKEVFPFQPLLEEVRELYDVVAEDKNIEIKTNVSKDTNLYADRLRIKQVLGNLLDNALKYSPPGSRIEISTDLSGSDSVIRIEDQGQGISDKDLPRIWDRLYRGDTHRSAGGSGLGLSLVKAIVKAHGGSVSAESKLARGAIFQIHLPRT
jgi:signal transduction histidine kinase